jgi:hypothetical protein
MLHTPQLPEFFARIHQMKLARPSKKLDIFHKYFAQTRLAQHLP